MIIEGAPQPVPRVPPLTLEVFLLRRSPNGRSPSARGASENPDVVDPACLLFSPSSTGRSRQVAGGHERAQPTAL